jgi:hypothetical protein
VSPIAPVNHALRTPLLLIIYQQLGEASSPSSPRLRLLRWQLDVPGQAQQGEGADEPVAHVGLPPTQAMSGRRREGVVGVVEPLPQRQDAKNEVVPACLSQENLRQARESLPPTAAPIIAATAAEQNQQHDDQEDDLESTHGLSLPWAKTGPVSAQNPTRSRSHAVITAGIIPRTSHAAWRTAIPGVSSVVGNQATRPG